MPIFMQMGQPGDDTWLKGPVTEPPHVGWFEVAAASFGVSRHAVHPGANPAGGAREQIRDIQELHINLPDGSPLFFKASIDGKPFDTVTLDFVRDGQSFLVIKLTTVWVASYSLSGAGDRPTAAVVLKFDEVEQHYSAASADLDSDTSYDLSNPVGDVLPLTVLRQLVNAVFGP